MGGSSAAGGKEIEREGRRGGQRLTPLTSIAASDRYARKPAVYRSGQACAHSASLFRHAVSRVGRGHRTLGVGAGRQSERAGRGASARGGGIEERRERAGRREGVAMGRFFDFVYCGLLILLGFVA